VSVTGVTGGEVEVGAELREFIARARRHVRVPLVVGFGVRTPEHASAIGGIADGVVIASALVRIIAEAPDPATAVERIDAFGAAVAAALRRPR
jgi:tryptophan synthase alpha chain